MTRRFTNLQTDLLRTFVTAVDLDNFTETGNVLGRTQPAISLQIKRLEAVSGGKLLNFNGKRIELTAHGQTLLGYARDILRLNDRAVANLHDARILGTLRIGLPVDYSVDYFQRIIARFAQSNPDVLLDVRCDRSSDLVDALHHDTLHMALAVTDSMPAPHVSLYWAERPVWVCGPDYQVDAGRPVMLIAHPEGCFYRRRMMDALNAEARRWHVSFESPNISAVQNAVMDGMGVTALTAKTLLPEMRILGQSEGFFPLANIHVGLFYKHVNMSDAALKLIEQIGEGVKTFRDPTHAGIA